MHYRSWLASATLFTISVSAFYPVNGNSSPEEEDASVPSLTDNTRGFADGQTPTIDIRKRRTNVSLDLLAWLVLDS